MNNETIVLKTMGNAVAFACTICLSKVSELGNQPKKDRLMTVLIISKNVKGGQDAFYELLMSFEALHGVQVDETKIMRVHVKNDDEAKHRLQTNQFDFVFMPEVCVAGEEDMLGKEHPIDASEYPELHGLVPTLRSVTRH